MVIGHTPQFHANGTGIQMTCQNNDPKYSMHGLYRIDFGGSHAFDIFDEKTTENRRPQVLEIVYEHPEISNDIPIVNILKKGTDFPKH